MDRDYHLTRNLLILAFGFVFILLSQVDPISQSRIGAGVLAAIGIAMVGYAPIQLFVYFQYLVGDKRRERAIDDAMRASVRRQVDKTELPTFFAIDISGLITPSNREEIDLRRLQRLKAYCSFVKTHPQFPPIVLFTGRSQGYVELLVQSLGMLNMPLDLPHIIENGSAFYRATAKRVLPLLSTEQIHLVQRTRRLLSDAFPHNEMEPKAYMITLNTIEGETIGDLREKVAAILTEQNLREDLHLSSSATGVDLTPRGITKQVALNRVLEYCSSEVKQRGLQAVVALGDTLSDLDVLRSVGRAYCPAENVDLEVRTFVQTNFGADNIIPGKDIDIVIKAIEKECGLKIM